MVMDCALVAESLQADHQAEVVTDYNAEKLEAGF